MRFEDARGERAMWEADDRLEGDPVWELFPSGTSSALKSPRRWLVWLDIAVVAGLTWLIEPALSIVTVCLGVPIVDLLASRRTTSAIPDRDGRRVCWLFQLGWASWKAAATGFGTMFVLAFLVVPRTPGSPMPASFAVVMLVWLCGFLASAILTAIGMVLAYRSGMRVWIGQGINQARTLLLSMLIFAFVVFAVGPWCAWLVGQPTLANNNRVPMPAFLVLMLGLMIGGPILILLILDHITRRIVADQPTKFGPKTPAVGKWKSNQIS